jgi:hypothetical protein
MPGSLAMTSRIHATAFATLCAMACAMTAPTAWASRFRLNDTGMTQCIDHHKSWTSDCAKSNQDAAFGRDVNDADPDDGVAGFSFRKVCRSGEMAGEGSCPADPVMGSGPDDWGCVYDNISKLTWENKTADGGLHDGKHRFTNQVYDAHDDPNDAAWLVASTNAEGLCGATNWRLPDVIELQSIVHYGMGTPGRTGEMIDPTFFPNTGGWTWTGIRSRSYFPLAWYVDFGLGGTRVYKPHNSLSVRLVHRGQAKQAGNAEDRFVPSADGTEVKDTLTGLIWRRCAEGKTWNSDTQTCDGHAREFTWLEALDHVEKNINRKWRMPNVKELYSLVDLEKASPAIDHWAFPHTRSSSFLTSTPVAEGSVVYVQLVEFSQGSVTQREAFGYDSWPLRLVRREAE